MIKLIPRFLMTVFFFIAVGFISWWLWNYYVYAPWTRDARVRAEVITLTPDVSGWVVNFHAHNHERVKKGQLLLRIDPDRYQNSVDQAKGSAASAKENWIEKQNEAARRVRLNNQAISYESKQNSIIAARVAKSQYDESLAELATAQLNLKRSYFYAPLSGMITAVTLTEGNYATSGEAFMALIVDDSHYIEAYMEETKIQQIHVGQPVRIRLMQGGPDLVGTVRSIGKGITISNTETGDEMLPSVDPSFNWIRLAQRIPVNIQVDWPKDMNIAVGMTATIEIETGQMVPELPLWMPAIPLWMKEYM